MEEFLMTWGQKLYPALASSLPSLCTEFHKGCQGALGLNFGWFWVFFFVPVFFIFSLGSTESKLCLGATQNWVWYSVQHSVTNSRAQCSSSAPSPGDCAPLAPEN